MPRTTTRSTTSLGMTPLAAEAALTVFLSSRKREVEESLLALLPGEGQEPRDLTAAMRYSTMAGGKRLRPVLCLAAAEVCGARTRRLPPRAELVAAAASLEFFHTYSLIHDDLPCMDDDSLRRGKPTCHVVFGEATALLAGDTLQTLGFEVLATRPAGKERAGLRAEAVGLVARAIGTGGMAGGQALDLAGTGEGARGPSDVLKERLVRIHSLKTGKLLQASAALGALYADADEPVRLAVSRYGEALGLLFQIADDLLDVTQDSATLGKTAGKDDAQEKLTYPALFGLDGARRELERALDASLAAALRVEGAEGLLASLAAYAAHRDR
jgi:geranylgeranyl pyrophosphate synthase